MKRYILLIILLVSCTSYNDDYEAETIMKYKNIYTEFENLSESQMENKLKLECNVLIITNHSFLSLSTSIEMSIS